MRSRRSIFMPAAIRTLGNKQRRRFKTQRRLKSKVRLNNIFSKKINVKHVVGKLDLFSKIKCLFILNSFLNVLRKSN